MLVSATLEELIDKHCPDAGCLQMIIPLTRDIFTSNVHSSVAKGIKASCNFSLMGQVKPDGREDADLSLSVCVIVFRNNLSKSNLPADCRYRTLLDAFVICHVNL